MIERRWRAVEADLQHHYGVDARTCGGRRLWTLIQGLPWGSRTFGFESEWSLELEFQAATLEHQIRVHGDRKTRKSKQRLVPRPAVEGQPSSGSAAQKLFALAKTLRREG